MTLHLMQGRDMRTGVPKLSWTLAGTVVIAVCAFGTVRLAAAGDPGSIKIKGNHPTDLAHLGAVVHADPAMELHLTVVLGLHDKAKLEQLLADQQNPSSNRYHKWLTPAEFNRRFGPSPAQTDAVVQWLRNQGLKVTSVNQLGRTIDATGSVAQAESAFATTIVTSGPSFGNQTDPAIPAEFEGLIAEIQGLDNMHAVMPAGLHRRPATSETPAKDAQVALADVSHPGVEGGPSVPGATVNGATAFGPFDIETFYNEAPLISGGNTGTASPDCVALDEDSDYLDAAVTLFASTFGFTPFSISRAGTSPGKNGDETEALLDIDYAHATAPGTPIRVYMNSSLYTSIQSSITDNACGAISISFIYCSSSSSFFTSLDSLFAQAASQGQSVFISSGDWGAAGLAYDSSSNSCVVGTTPNASEMAGSPHVTGVGGTTFSPQYNSSGNDISVVGVAPGGIESGWNGSGGGASQIFSKPAWQTGTGVPNDSARDVPDVSMIAWTPGVFVGADSSGTAQIQCCWGGTSLAAPLWAGYSRALAKAQNVTRLGLLNPTIYSLAGKGLLANGIEDVTSGNNTYNGVTGFNAGVGYDQVTGWGSVDMTAFASAYSGAPTPTPTPKPTSTPTPTPKPTPTPTPGPLNVSISSLSFGTVKVGRSSSSVTVTLSNPSSDPGSTTISSASLMTGTNFAIASSTCTSGKVLAPGASCKVGVKFTPKSTGAKTDTLQFFDNAQNGPQTVRLSGTGK
jgi:subtilase family serine protease